MSRRTIWKYVVPPADNVMLYVPEGARPLHVGGQAGAICLWMEVDPARASVPREFLVRGTGNPFTGMEGTYLGTVIIGHAVWHVFEPARKAAER